MTISVLKQPWWFGMLHAKPNAARAARLLEPVSMKLRMFQTQWGHRQICRNLQEKSLIHNAKTMVSCEFPLKSIELSLRVKKLHPNMAQWPNISLLKTLLAHVWSWYPGGVAADTATADKADTATGTRSSCCWPLPMLWRLIPKGQTSVTHGDTWLLRRRCFVRKSSSVRA